jgi:hypothetical protein
MHYDALVQLRSCREGQRAEVLLKAHFDRVISSMMRPELQKHKKG